MAAEFVDGDMIGSSINEGDVGKVYWEGMESPKLNGKEEEVSSRYGNSFS
jgi:hypothetical protein